MSSNKGTSPITEVYLLKKKPDSKQAKPQTSLQSIRE